MFYCFLIFFTNGVLSFFTFSYFLMLILLFYTIQLLNQKVVIFFPKFVVFFLKRV